MPDQNASTADPGPPADHEPTRTPTPASPAETHLHNSQHGEHDPRQQSTHAETTALPLVPGYEILSVLGQGAMGVVYKARQTRLNRFVALKMILGESRGHGLNRFLAEAEAIAAVEHPHVVRVHEFGEAGGRPYIALEYLSGGTLAEHLKSTSPAETPVPLPPFDAARLLQKIASGVAAAHEQGIVHRDLKPGNVLFDVADNVVSPLGEPKVADFGLAKRGTSDLTATGAVMGTPAYMSPEQASGDTKFVGPQADVWALGVILYECLTGVRPFQADELLVMLVRLRTEDPVPPRKIVPGVPRDLERVCLKCLEKSPADRYPTAKELADDLARFLNGEPVAVRSAGLFERGYKWAKRKPTLAGLTVALSLLLLTTTGLVAYFRLAAQQRQLLQLRDGEEALEKAELYFETDRRDEGILWAARGLFLLEESGVTRAEAWEARMQLSLWGQSVAWFHTVYGMPTDEFIGPRRGSRPTKGSGTALPLGDGKSLLATTQKADGTLVLVRYDAESGRAVAEYPLGLPSDQSADYYTIDSDFSRVVVWHTLLGKPVPLNADEPPAPNRHPISGYHLYDYASGKLLRHVALTGPVDDRVFDWSRDLTTLVIVNSQSGKVELWNGLTGTRIAELERFARLTTRPARRYEFAQLGQRFWMLDRDGVVHLWDTATGRAVAEVRHPAPQSEILSVATDEDNNQSRLITGGVDGTLRVWDTATGEAVGAPIGVGSPFVQIREPVRARIALVAGTSEPPDNGVFQSITSWNLDTHQRSEVRNPLYLSPNGEVEFNLLEGNFFNLKLKERIGRGIVQRQTWTYDPALRYTPDSRLLVLHYGGQEPERDKEIRVLSTKSGRLIGPRLICRNGGLITQPDRLFIVDHPTNSKKLSARFIHLKPLEGSAERIKRWAEWLTGKEIDSEGHIVPINTANNNNSRRVFNGLAMILGSDPNAARFDDREPALPPWR